MYLKPKKKLLSLVAGHAYNINIHRIISSVVHEMFDVAVVVVINPLISKETFNSSKTTTTTKHTVYENIVGIFLSFVFHFFFVSIQFDRSICMRFRTH